MRKRSLGEKPGLLAAGAGADLEDDVLVVVRVLGQQQNHQVAFKLRLFRGEGGEVFLGQVADFGVSVVQQFAAFLDAGQGLLVPAKHRDDLAEVRVLAHGLLVSLPVADEAGVAQMLFEFDEALFDALEFGIHGSFTCARRRRKKDLGRGEIPPRPEGGWPIKMHVMI